MTDEIQKKAPATDAQKQRMAKARAVRAANRAAREAEAGQLQQGVAQQPEATAGLQRAGTRTPLRVNSTGRVEVVGRNGEILSRSRVQGTDQFEIPASMIPPGWDYQWNPVTVMGNGEVVRDTQMTMYANGWRPVPAERHVKDHLVEHSAKGHIIRGQMILEERPKSLSEEARAEDLRNARQLVSDRNESLKLTKVNQELPEGFDARAGGIRMQIDKSLDVANLPRPEHKLAE